MLRSTVKVSLIITRQYCAPSRKPEISSLSRVLKKAFGKYLLWTNTISSGALMFVGDIIEQELEYQQKVLQKRYDFGRLFRMTLVGLSQGPLHHYYYSWLSRVMPDRRLWTITKKILLDQFIVSPVCIVSFYYAMAFLESQSLKDSTNELKEKFLEIYMVDWAVWPPTQFINFYLVPDRFQVLYINSITTVYNVFLSYVKHKKVTKEGAGEELVISLTSK